MSGSTVATGTGTGVQHRYWAELVSLRVHLYYIQDYRLVSEEANRRLEIFLALASSSSVAAWIIWDPLSFLWAGIVAVAQGVNVVKHHLPYEKRSQALQQALPEISQLTLAAEGSWFDVSSGAMSGKQINDRTIEIKAKKDEILDRYVSELTLPEKKDLMVQSQQRAQVYFRNHYGV